MRINIATKLIVSFVLLLSLFLGATAYVTIKTAGNDLTTATLITINEDLSARSREIDLFLNTLKSNILLLANIPLTDQEIFRNMQTNDIYEEIVYLNKYGDEVLKVDFNNGLNFIDKLTNKKEDEFFKGTMLLDKGLIYISPLELNRGDDGIKEPYTAIIKYATPIFDRNGNKEGIVMAKIRASNILSGLQERRGSGSMFLLDNKGYYLSNPIREREWGSSNDLNTGENVKRYLPQISDKILSGDSGTVVHLSNVVSFAPVSLDKANNQNFWVIMKIVPEEVALLPVESLKSTLIAMFLITLGVLVISLYIASKMITIPINKLTAAVNDISSGKLNTKIEGNERKDEIGELSRAFERTVVSLKIAMRSIRKNKKP